MRDALRTSLGLLRPGTRRLWYALVPLALVAAAAEAFGAAAVFGLLTIIGDPARAAALPIAADVRAWLGEPDPRSLIAMLTLLLTGFYVLRNLVLGFAAWAQERVVRTSVLELSRRLLLGYFTAPYAFHFRRNSAGLIQRVCGSVEVTLTLVLSSLMHIATEALIAAGIVAVLAAAAPLETLIAVGATAVLILVPTQLAGRALARLGREHQGSEERLLQTLQQSLGAIKELKIAGREDFFHRRFSEVAEGLAHLQRRHSTYNEVQRLVVETVFVVALLLVVMILTLGGRAGQDVVSLLGLYGYAGFRLVPSANRIGRNLNQIRVGRPFMEDVAEDLATVEQYAASTGDRDTNDDAPVFAEAVRFESVSYAYDAESVPALTDASFVIRRGESIGIVGHTGAGKSTLVDLLLGLLQPTSGRITVDGRDLATHVRGWQRQIGYVPQTFALFDDTLRRNIAFGLRDEEVDAHRLAAAVRAAQLEEVVVALPDGLDSIVGERGIRLSGGQRQRVVIARALYGEPRVLVFDEATSALDNQTEREIARAVDSLHGAATLIVVAHRLSTVRNCDRLIYIERGRVAAIGSFGELLASEPGFREMATAGEGKVPQPTSSS